MNKRNVGTFYENVAELFLVEQGIKIVERNYRCRFGEIDLIGVDKDTLVFFEVKYRKNTQYGSPFDAVDNRKQRKILSVAKYYLSYKGINKFIRFDVVGIFGNEIEWIKDAFCAY